MLRARVGTTKAQITANLLLQAKFICITIELLSLLCCSHSLWDKAVGELLVQGRWHDPAEITSPVRAILWAALASPSINPKPLNISSLLPRVGVTAEGLAGLSLYQQGARLC